MHMGFLFSSYYVRDITANNGLGGDNLHTNNNGKTPGNASSANIMGSLYERSTTATASQCDDSAGDQQCQNCMQYIQQLK